MTFRFSELQRWFVAVSTHEAGVAAGARSAHRALGLPGETPVEAIVTPGPQLGAAERLQIYNDGYFARLTECLADDYPALSHALGEEAFSALARDYIRRTPSRSPSLNEYGRRMPAFCRERSEPWAAFAADLCRLEWALVEVVHSPVSAGLSPGAFSSVPAAAWDTARLVPSPALRVLAFDYPVGDYYQAFLAGRASELPARRRSATAVYRQGMSLWRMSVEPSAVRLLQDLVSEAPLGTAIAALERRTDAEARAGLGEKLSKWLSTWISNGFFVAVELT